MVNLNWISQNWELAIGMVGCIIFIVSFKVFKGKRKPKMVSLDIHLDIHEARIKLRDIENTLKELQKYFERVEKSVV